MLGTQRRRAGGRSLRRRQLRDDLDRQGRQPDQRDGRVETGRRDLLPDFAAASQHALHDRAIRQRARFGRQRRAAFREQIRARRPGDRHPSEITRYFMTIPEACQLVLQAGALGKGARSSSSTWASRSDPLPRRADDPPRRTRSRDTTCTSSTRACVRVKNSSRNSSIRRKATAARATRRFSSPSRARCRGSCSTRNSSRLRPRCATTTRTRCDAA